MQKSLAALLLALFLLSAPSAAEILGRTKAAVKQALGKPFMEVAQGPVWKMDKLYLYVEFESKGPRDARKANLVTYEAFTRGDVIDEATRNKLMAEHGEFGSLIKQELGWATKCLHLSKDGTTVARYYLGEKGTTRKMDVLVVARLSDESKELLGL